MAKMNFSQEDMKTYNLALDLARGDFELHTETEGGKLSKADLEEHLRNTINNDILQGRTLYQAFRRNKNVIFEIVENIVTTTIGENVLNSPFINRFVEVKNGAFGEKNIFYSEGGLLSVASFAGNHWDTNRQAVDLGNAFSLPTEWVYIHVYDELERFLMRASSLERLVDKVYKSINKYIQDRLYAQFQNVATAVPDDFSKTGNDEDTLGELVDLVASAGGYSDITIAGTKGALRKLANIVPEKMFANSQKEAKAQSGSIGDWEGNTLMVIPQTLKSGTFDFALDNDKVFILSGDAKPIKLFFEGDSRTDEDTTGKKNNDMSIDLQVQTKLGMGLLLPEYFGVYTFA